MSKFKVIENPIKGLLIVEPITHSEVCIPTMEQYSEQELSEVGIEGEFVYESRQKLARGILSGLHFQRENTQAKVVRVVSGAVLYVAVDLRPDSRDYGASWSVEVSAENQRIVYIPEQFAHGFLTLEKNTEIISDCNNPDNAKDVAGVIWHDAILTIDWEFERYDIDEKYLRVSDRDKRLPAFRSWTPSAIWK